MEKTESKSKVIDNMLEEHGLLLLSDSTLPSLVSLVVGGPIRGSWWGHPMGKQIYALADRLEDTENVITAKLVSKKVTFVHKKLWPQLARIGCADESWQTEKLSAPAVSLLRSVREQQVLTTNSLPKTLSISKPGKVCDELEKKLLIHTEAFHSESGSHYKRLQTWESWSNSRNIDLAKTNLQQSKEDFAKILEALNTSSNANATLPWQC